MMDLISLVFFNAASIGLGLIFGVFGTAMISSITVLIINKLTKPDLLDPADLIAQLGPREESLIRAELSRLIRTKPHISSEHNTSLGKDKSDYFMSQILSITGHDVDKETIKLLAREEILKWQKEMGLI